MTQLFDSYDKSYGSVVQSSIDFSGLPHSFFLSAKAELIRERVAQHFGAGAKPDGLDVGCGLGTFHPLVRSAFGRFCGADVSASCIAQARASNRDVDYADYDGAHLPYDDRSFDFVSAICVMHHVPPAQWQNFTREMWRVLQPGGLLCVIEHNPLNPLTRLAVARCEFDRDAVLLRVGQTQRLMDGAGLRNVHSRYFLLLPSAAAPFRRIERLFGSVPLGAQYMTCGEA